MIKIIYIYNEVNPKLEHMNAGKKPIVNDWYATIQT
jgi:hypothetical protein